MNQLSCTLGNHIPLETMVLQAFTDSTEEDLEIHETIIQGIFEHLHSTLARHCRQGDPAHLFSEYHAHISVGLQGPNTGLPIINWHCHYCRYIYNYARILNQRLNGLRHEMHQLNPLRPNTQEPSTEMTEFLRRPFPPISDQVILDTLSALRTCYLERVQNEPLAFPTEASNGKANDAS